MTVQSGEDSYYDRYIGHLRQYTCIYQKIGYYDRYIGYYVKSVDIVTVQYFYLMGYYDSIEVAKMYRMPYVASLFAQKSH